MNPDNTLSLAAVVLIGLPILMLIWLLFFIAA
jgi:hypothetical protein